MIKHTIGEIDYDDTKPFHNEMKKEHVDTKSTPNTRYFGVYVGGELAGFVGVMDKGVGLVRFKFDYVRPEFRGKGLYNALFQYRLEKYRDRKISAFCTNMSVGTYKRYGFMEIWHKEATNITFLKRNEEL